jgi:Potential Queuosine, Q, salvage protein family
MHPSDSTPIAKVVEQSSSSSLPATPLLQQTPPTTTTTTPSSSSSRNPCALVRQSCCDYVQHDRCRFCVTINEDAIPILARQIIQQQKLLSTNSAKVEWDEEQWHYRCFQNDTVTTATATDVAKQTMTTIDTKNMMTTVVNTTVWPKSIRKERLALYILALDSINFSFWTATRDDNRMKYEYEDLAVTLTNMAQSDHMYQQQVIDNESSPEMDYGKDLLSSQFIFSPHNLQNMTVDQMTTLFQNYHSKGWVPPNIQERCAIWNEIGTVLNQEPFNGSLLSLIDMANCSAPALVQLLIDFFPNFRDDTTSNETTTTTGPRLYFYKRAQICVGDWNAALSSAELLQLRHMDLITTFADYRVPQLLRHYNILLYSSTLADIVDRYIEILPGSDEELAIRASTVAAVELLVLQLQSILDQEIGTGSEGKSDEISKTVFHWNAIQTDWYLWQVGERMENANQLQPHHRVRTTYY